MQEPVNFDTLGRMVYSAIAEPEWLESVRVYRRNHIIGNLAFTIFILTVGTLALWVFPQFRWWFLPLWLLWIPLYSSLSHATYRAEVTNPTELSLSGLRVQKQMYPLESLSSVVVGSRHIVVYIRSKADRTNGLSIPLRLLPNEEKLLKALRTRIKVERIGE